MPGEIRIGIIPEIDQKRLAEFKEQLSNLNVDVNTERQQAQAPKETQAETKSYLQALKDVKAMDTSSLDKEARNKAEIMQFASEGFKKGAEGLMNITTQAFDVLNTIYKELKKSSPLLEAIDQIFQLAWQLFFMPLGNKLGELLIPAVIELVDGVVSLWNEIGDGKLGDIFGTAIHMGVQLLAKFFNNIGDSLKEQGGLLGQIGRLFESIGNFVDKHLEDLIGLIINLSTFVIENIPLIIGLIGTFMTLHYTLQLATMAVIAASAPDPLSKTAAALTVASVAAALAGTAGTIWATSQFAAEGAYVPATPGGQHYIVGEGGEDEWIVPKSKVIDFAQNVLNGDTISTTNMKVENMSEVSKANTSTSNVYNINIQGYTDNELKSFIKDVVNDEIGRSRIRSGF